MSDTDDDPLGVEAFQDMTQAVKRLEATLQATDQRQKTHAEAQTRAATDTLYAAKEAMGASQNALQASQAQIRASGRSGSAWRPWALFWWRLRAGSASDRTADGRKGTRQGTIPHIMRPMPQAGLTPQADSDPSPSIDREASPSSSSAPSPDGASLPRKATASAS